MEKKYFSIKEVSEKLNLPASTLRFWEKEIDALCPQKSAGGVRRYVQKDIELLRQIKFLIDEQHLTLEGVKERLLNHSEEDERRIKVIQKLQNVRKELLAIRLELNGHEAFDTEFVIDEDDKEESEI